MAKTAVFALLESTKLFHVKSDWYKNLEISSLCILSLQNDEPLEPKLSFLTRDELKTTSRQIRREVEIINNTLSENDKIELLTDVNNEDPMGYICEKTLMEIKELQYVDQLLCFNTTEEICYKVSFFRK